MKESHKKNLIIGAIILGIIAIIAIILFVPSSNNGNSINSKLSIGNSPVLGDENAPVTIYEFSDFSCPYCATAEGKNQYLINALKAKMPGWEAPLPAIKEEYVKTGKVKIVFRYFPGHGASTAAHAVALGLNEQNPKLFWEFADKVFTLQSTIDLNNVNSMINLAKQIGANETALKDYLNTKKYESQLKEDIKMAEDVGIKGTPTFFINGKIIEGAQSFSLFKDMIDEEIS
ncbi:MAG: thioredoxin domain-containing protein [Candidatus Pacearchaeota archaeon]